MTNDDKANRSMPGLDRVTALMTMLVVLALLTSAQAADMQAGSEAYGRGDYAGALLEWRPLAEQGNAKAQFNMGLLYENGEGVPQNHAEAAGWYRKAAEQDLAEAQVNLGLLYEKGEGVPQNHAEAARWYL